MLPIEIREYVDEGGRTPFRRWASKLDDRSFARINAYLERLADGNVSNVKSVGKGVNELRIDYGPGYRVYFGWDGRTLIVLLGGGTKSRQQKDIADAQARWEHYKKSGSARG